MKRPPNNEMSVVKTRQKLTIASAIETIVRNVWVIHEDFELLLRKFILPVFTSVTVMRRSF